MSTINAIKIKQADGTYSSEIPIGVSATNVQWDTTNSLTDILGAVDYSTKGSIQDQIDGLSGGGGNSLEYVVDYVNPTTNVKTTGVVEGDIVNNKATGSCSHAQGFKTQATGYYSHAEGHLSKATGPQSHAEGASTQASGTRSHAEGNGCKAKGMYSHAEGYNTQARDNYSHAEGNSTYASASCAHAEGLDSQALGPCSHAEGRDAGASGRCSHVQGFNCRTMGMIDEDEDGEDDTWYGECAHAEGYNCECWGDYSHAEGYMTVAERPFTHVEGRLNQILDENEGIGFNKVPRYAHIIGGGYYPNEYPESWSNMDSGDGGGAVRRDIHRVDWDGNAWYAGSLTLGNTTLTEANLQALLNLLS